MFVSDIFKHVWAPHESGREGVIVYESVPLLHPMPKFDAYRFVADSSQMILELTDLGSFKLISVSNQLKKATFKLHSISCFKFCICWVNEKYVCIQ